MRHNWKASFENAISGQWAYHGAWTRPILRLKASGFTCTALLIKKARQLILCCQKSAMSLLQGNFLRKRSGSSGLPDKVTMDKSDANKAGVNTITLALALLCMFGGLPLQITIRQIKYLNNIIEQDHRFVKKITNGMRGFKAFHSAEATLSGIELHHMLRKDQHTQSSNTTIFEQFYGLAA